MEEGAGLHAAIVAAPPSGEYATEAAPWKSKKAAVGAAVLVAGIVACVAAFKNGAAPEPGDASSTLQVAGTPGQGTVLRVNSLVPFAGYAGNEQIGLKSGTAIEVRLGADQVQLKASLVGLNATAGKQGGFHVHAGSSCDDAFGVGGVHFYEGDAASLDPWLATKYPVPDSNGEAQVDVTVSSFYPSDFAGKSTAGRVVVVHDSTGAKAACGVIEEVRDAPYTRGWLRPYFDLNATTTPGRARASQVSSVVVKAGTSDASFESLALTEMAFQMDVGGVPWIKLNGAATSAAEPSAALASPRVALLKSLTCSDVRQSVLACYNNSTASPALCPPLGRDWAGDVLGAPYALDDMGSADLLSTGRVITLGNVTLEQALGKAVVLMNGDLPYLCGYVARPLLAEGYVSISTDASGKTTLEGWASGLQMNDGVVNGAHVHVGASCAVANGGHLLVNGTDPYANFEARVTVTTLQAEGKAKPARPFARTYFKFEHNVTGASAADVAGRTFTLHDSNGNRIACAELGAVAPQPTASPSKQPTHSPTRWPTAPTSAPSASPTRWPTEPTSAPSQAPTTAQPTPEPTTARPTTTPTATPTTSTPTTSTPTTSTPTASTPTTMGTGPRPPTKWPTRGAGR